MNRSLPEIDEKKGEKRKKKKEYMGLCPCAFPDEQDNKKNMLDPSRIMQ